MLLGITINPPNSMVSEAARSSLFFMLEVLTVEWP